MNPSLRQYLAVALGGVAGAGVRWAVASAFGAEHGFHWSIFIVNVVGCFLLGLVLGEEARTRRFRTQLQDFGAIGFCGGLTTMSTFALDVARLVENNDFATAATYCLANVVVGLLVLVIGAAIARRSNVLTMPVEQRP